MFILIGSGELNGVNAQAWLADVLDRIADMRQHRLHERLAWLWKAGQHQTPAA